MEVSKKNSLTPTELIDWLNDEGILELDWDFPEDGDLVAAGLNPTVTAQLMVAVEDRFGIELGSGDLTPANLATPITLAALLVLRTS